MRIFPWSQHDQRLPDAATLGQRSIALRVTQDSVVPAACIGVCIDASGHASRVDAGRRMVLAGNEIGYWVHPGPYVCDIIAHAATPEIGLRLHLVLDTPDPRVARQRFDLFLASEVGAEADLTLDGLCGLIQTTLQTELARATLALEPCATAEEWMQFRADLNQLLYTRFGLTVEECLPVDLGDEIDYAQLLLQRLPPVPEPVEAAGTAEAMPPALPATPALNATIATIATPATFAADMAQRDAHGLRRLFLELPQLCSGLRLLSLPSGIVLFQQQQALLQRLDLLSLSASTMTALAWASPDHALNLSEQGRRAAHLLEAVRDLDEAWALLARLKNADAEHLPQDFDHADRVISNLESHLAARRSAQARLA